MAIGILGKTDEPVNIGDGGTGSKGGCCWQLMRMCSQLPFFPIFLLPFSSIPKSPFSPQRTRSFLTQRSQRFRKERRGDGKAGRGRARRFNLRSQVACRHIAYRLSLFHHREHGEISRIWDPGETGRTRSFLLKPQNPKLPNSSDFNAEGAEVSQRAQRINSTLKTPRTFAPPTGFTGI
jgi:hypothetical protein